jgi:hypothetical protein
MKSPFETEYFVREDAERIRKLAHTLRKQLEAAERERQRALHWMRCPRCGLEMHQVTYRGVNGDVCLGCHGIFLDERELAHAARRHEPGGLMSGILNWFRPEVKG